MEILVTPLLAEDEETTNDDVESNAGGAHPPCKGIADEVDMTVILDPKVDSATESGPMPWSRIVGMSAGKAGVGPPHYFLEFPPFPDESWEFIVDLWCIGRD